MHETLLIPQAGTPATTPQPIAAGAARVFSVFAIYALFSFVLLKGSLFGNRSFVACCDASVQSYAWLGKVAAAARHFTIPLWDFSVLAGVSFAGELQPGPFYPPTWVLGLLGFEGMPLVDTFMVLHFTLAAGFMHLLLRSVGLGRIASIAGALIFSFSGYVPVQASAQPNIFAGLVWLPLVLLFYRQAIAATQTRVALTYTAFAGAAGAMQIIAGHLQPFIYTSYAAGIYAVIESVGAADRRSDVRRWPLRPFALLVIGQMMAAGFAAVPLALSMQYLRLVYRWFDNGAGVSTFPHSVTFKSWAESAVLVWSDFRGLINPAFRLEEHDGSIFFTLIGLFAVAFTLIRPGRFALFLWILATAALIIALGGNAGPIARITYYMPLLAQTRTPIRAMYLFSFAAAALAAVGIDRIGRLFSYFIPHAGTAVAAALLLGVLYELSAFTMYLGMPSDSRQYAPRYYNADPGLAAIERLSNSGPLIYRFVAQPVDLVPPNAGDVKPVLNVDGHRGTRLISEFAYRSQGWDPGASDQLNRLGVRWVISDKLIRELPLIEQGLGYFIFERPGALSVFWMLDPNTGTRTPAPVEAVQWGENKVDIRLGPVEAGRKLVFAQPSYPGWVAFADGGKMTIEKEEIFPAIAVTGATRNVTFAYRPLLWPWIGVSLTCVLFAALAALSWAYPRRMTPLVGRMSALSKRTGLARILTSP
jgi:hypothetical protein